MTREEVLKHRNEAISLADRLDKLGDYDVNAGPQRQMARSIANLWQERLDRMPKTK